ncbi:hypothetical protein ACFWY6_33180, partial [Streptomyces sp. NPDC059037]
MDTLTAPTGLPPRRTGLFERLAAFSHRHRWRALSLWVAAVIGVTAVAGLVGSDYHNDFSLPGTDAQAARTLLEEHGAAQAGDVVQIVLKDGSGVEGGRGAPAGGGRRARGGGAAGGRAALGERAPGRAGGGGGAGAR